jgi:hypothetical protein
MSEVGVRYMIDDVPAAVQFYTELLGFTVERDASPAFAAVSRDGVRLPLAGIGALSAMAWRAECGGSSPMRLRALKRSAIVLATP